MIVAVVEEVVVVVVVVRTLDSKYALQNADVQGGEVNVVLTVVEEIALVVAGKAV